MKWLWLAAVVIALDQISKKVMTAALDLYESVEVLPFFDLTLVHNYGAAFSFLNSAGGWQRWLFSGFAIVVSAAIMYWLPRQREERLQIPLALAMILGGTLGNLVDRVALGYVVDFLDFHARGMHFPAFNVADSAITVGAAILIFDAFIRQPTTSGSHG